MTDYDGYKSYGAFYNRSRGGRNRTTSLANTDREAIVRLYLNSKPPLTMREVADQYGVSVPYVSQLVRRYREANKMEGL